MKDVICPVNICYTSEAAREIYESAGGFAPATEGSAGIDLRMCGEADVFIAPGERVLVPSGISVQPKRAGVASFVYSRSGLGAREGITVAQGVGLIDPDYTGEIRVMLLNTSSVGRVVRRGERMAQLVFQPFFRADCTVVPALDSTARGSGGFGHTGAV